VRAHVADCDACREHVARLAAHAEKHRQAFAAGLGHRAAPSRFARVMVMVALAAAVLLFLRFRRDEATVRFKSADVHLSVVRERQGQQERLVSDVRVRPGDRIRTELALGSAQSVTAGVLDSTGAWVTLVTPATLEPGTHYSEVSALFDEHPPLAGAWRGRRTRWSAPAARTSSTTFGCSHSLTSHEPRLGRGGIPPRALRPAVRACRTAAHSDRCRPSQRQRGRASAALKGTRYLWLFGKENVPEQRAGQFASLQALRLKNGPCVGHQGDAARPLGLPFP